MPPRATCRRPSTLLAGNLPAGLPSQTDYRKVNPADAPIMLLSLAVGQSMLPQMYDTANSVLAQKLAQIEGVGQVFVGGSSNPAVRVQVNPQQLNSYGISLENVRTRFSAANAQSPQGRTREPAAGPGQSTTPISFSRRDEYRPLVVSWRKAPRSACRTSATVIDSVEDVRNSGLTNGRPGIILVIFRQPGANMIETVDRVRAMMPTSRLLSILRCIWA